MTHQPISVVRPAETSYHVATCSCGWKAGFLDKDQAKSALFSHVATAKATDPK